MPKASEEDLITAPEATKAQEEGRSRFPGVERLIIALTSAAFVGAGSESLLGGGLAMSLTAGGLTAAIYLREVVRGGTSWRELLLLVPVAAVILLLLGLVLDEGDLGPEVGKARIIGVAGEPRAIASSPDGVWIASADGTVSLIGPTGIRLETQLGRGLRDVAYRFGHAWVARDQELLAVRKDDDELELRGSRRYDSQIAALAVARRGIWMLRPAAGRVDLVRPGSGQVAVSLPVDHARAIATDGRHLWVARAAADGKPGLLLEFSEAGLPLRRIPIDPDPRALAVDGQRVWISFYDSGELTEVAKRTGEEERVSTDSSSPASIALGAASVWVVDEEGEDLTQVDPGEKGPVGKVSAGREPMDVVFWRKAVFVVSGVDGVLKIFPVTYGRSGKGGVPGLTHVCS